MKRTFRFFRYCPRCGGFRFMRPIFYSWLSRIVVTHMVCPCGVRQDLDYYNRVCDVD